MKIVMENILGKFKDGKEHGKGTYTYPDGVKYEGMKQVGVTPH